MPENWNHNWIGPRRFETTLEPVTGKALPMTAGEVMRITQVEGGQCVDFNAFNIEYYRERLDVGRTRAYAGMFPKEGDFAYTNSPHDRPMFYLSHMPETCKAETLGARCNATLFERMYGFPHHTNCQDTFAESIGEYHLSPDDVHDSLNFFMNTEVDETGKMVLHANTGQPGDYIDLVAMFDVLAVPIVCGSGDVFTTSNFRLKPLQVEIFEATEATRSFVVSCNEKLGSFSNQRSPEQFRVGGIWAKPQLERDPDYEPEFPAYPLIPTDFELDLDESEIAQLAKLRSKGTLPDLLRDDELPVAAAMTWFMQHSVLPSGAGTQFVMSD